MTDTDLTYARSTDNGRRHHDADSAGPTHRRLAQRSSDGAISTYLRAISTRAAAGRLPASRHSPRPDMRVSRRPGPPQPGVSCGLALSAAPQR